MGYLAGLATGFISFGKKESRIAYLLTACYAWILFGFNTFNLDYANYQARFEGSSGMISEPLFLLMFRIFRRLGFRYQAFLVLYAAICLILISVVIIKYSPYPAAVLFMYILFPFCYDTVQMRFFLASSIFLLASCLLIEYKLRPNLLYVCGFIALVCIAAGFHYSAVFFLAFLVLFLDHKRYGFLQFIIIPLGLIGICVVLPRIFELVGSVIGMEKANAWIASIERATLTRMIRLLIIRGGMVILCLIAKYIPWEKGIRYDEDAAANRIDHTLFMLTLYSMLFVVLEIFLSSAYERLTRPGLLFGWIYISRRIRLTNRETKVLMWILMLGLLAANFYTNLFMGTARGGTRQFESVFLNMFNNNAIF